MLIPVCICSLTARMAAAAAISGNAREEAFWTALPVALGMLREQAAEGSFGTPSEPASPLSPVLNRGSEAAQLPLRVSDAGEPNFLSTVCQTAKALLPG